MPAAQKAAVGDEFRYIHADNAEKKAAALRKAGYTVTVSWQKSIHAKPSTVRDWKGRPADAESVQAWRNLHVVTVTGVPEG